MSQPTQSIPIPARVLGGAGLIPFFAAALAAVWPGFADHDFALRALIAYGAVILSFLGGVRWGLAIAERPDALWGPLAVSVAPSLGGWVALLLPAGTGLVLLALGFAVMVALDGRLVAAPAWYRRLRLPLSAGAILALLVGLAAR